MKVKFGLKPTLRVLQLIAMRGTSAGKLACGIAEKQLYSSHYFETALTSRFVSPTLTIPSSPASTLLRQWAPSKPD